ncbi:hypothetical protein CROQUDRAFT_651906 [Cronartium quercuum f. sp. fusiforme G11]|uniref:3-dehydroquinate synthase domain-containing protein n=1 Tax=Cronartium quercuum f. sp. fusiforme G11 TaxID=708437 RepID=A0A9P6NP27_9BASI|nr:hypothetical protein CROQUDRAFT_651906 [Cronartium quercuum f. sp. fusiforme G11]
MVIMSSTPITLATSATDVSGKPSALLNGSDLKATVEITESGWAVKGSEKLAYSFVKVDEIFSLSNTHLSAVYELWGRCLLVTDQIVWGFYKERVETYFNHYQIPLTIKIMPGGELHKTMDTMLSLIDAFNKFGLVRKEPVLVLGGGLVTDVCGYACASYRRSSNFIRIPTTLIGLIDASVSIKVAVNHGKLKNRLGAYHAPLITYLDFTSLKTLPIDQVRNGFAELMKISAVGDIRIWSLLVKYGVELIETKFGRLEIDSENSDQIRAIADEVCERGIKLMLDLETPNLHEIGLDRVIAFGHTWSPTLELRPKLPLRHGHAIAIDMAYSATLAWSRSYITETDRDEVLDLFHAVGLSVDHDLFDDDLIEKGTVAILKTRDGKQRFAVPKPLGTPFFINDASMDELKDVLKKHKALVKEKYGSGVGIGAYVDAGDLGEDPEEYGHRTEYVKKEPNGHYDLDQSSCLASSVSLPKTNGHPVSVSDKE